MIGSEAPADPAVAFAADLDAALAAGDEAPQAGAPPADAGPADPAADWRQFLEVGAMPIVAGLILPQWELTSEEQRELATALAECLAKLFPGGIGGEHACWFRLMAAAGGVCILRYAQHGRLPGIGPKPKPPPAPRPAVPPPPAPPPAA